MNLNTEKSNKNLIYEISTLKNYIGKNKLNILTEKINERLNKSLITYYQQLNKSLEKLYVYNENNSDRLINKLNKGN